VQVDLLHILGGQLKKVCISVEREFKVRALVQIDSFLVLVRLLDVHDCCKKEKEVLFEFRFLFDLGK